VRRALTLAGLDPGDLVLAGCSGGPDSLALAAAVAFEAPRLSLRAGAVIVDHGLQAGSADLAVSVRAALDGLGLDPVQVYAADVPGRGAGAAGYPGPEAAARRARHDCFERALKESGARVILLGHTMDDQAETVLLGLARGSGARSIAGMAPASGQYLRPLLGLRRSQTVAACSAQGLVPWHDPQNSDSAFTRTRVRRQLLPLMESLIGPGVTESLARTASQLRADTEALDDLAAAAASRLIAVDGSVAVADLAELAAAIRTRVLKRAAIAAGAPAGSLTASHVGELDALVVGWRGQRGLDLPGGVRCRRRYGRLQFTR
jgi:tRNA(Ile)-lysidine synthase